MTGYEIYCLYLALKNHFTRESYDYFKYNGKVPASKEAFLSRRDRFQFEKFARKKVDHKAFIIANMLENKTWIGELLDDGAEDIYQQYVKTTQSMSYIFKNELESIEDLSELFKGPQPDIIYKVMGGQMSIQTFVILDHFIRFIPKFDARLKDDFLWDKLSIKAKKYKPFLLQDLDLKKFKEILKAHPSAPK